ncbi:MAG: DUF899 domain-containing protein [Steroidobacter sp.]
MATTDIALPKVASRAEWLAARKALLEKEKEATRIRDAVNAERRRLPMVKVDKDYIFEGPAGKVRLIDIFEGRRQLYIHHFMWIDAHDTACPSCSIAADMNFNSIPLLAQLQERDITFAAVSRAPFGKIAEYKAHKGWTFPWYSSFGNDFNYDLHVTLDEAKAPIEYNYRRKEELIQTGMSEDMLNGDWPGNSVFLRHGDNVFHAYSAYARGLDQLFTPFNFLDLTPYGRQEDWEDSPAGWPQRRTYG